MSGKIHELEGAELSLFSDESCKTLEREDDRSRYNGEINDMRGCLLLFCFANWFHRKNDGILSRSIYQHAEVLYRSGKI